MELAGSVLVMPRRGKLFEQRSKDSQPIAVGDRVLVSGTAPDLAIDRVLPRSSRLARDRAGDDGREQVLVANATLVIVVSSLALPRCQPELVDRILAAAAREGIAAALVFTKADAADPEVAMRLPEVYRRLGYSALVTSSDPGHLSHQNLTELAKLLHDNDTVLCGLSGAGKSTLLNCVVPGLGLRVGDLGAAAHGRHTTTHAVMIPLPGGGHVFDTPGVRSFGLSGLSPDEVADLFQEIGTKAHACSYRNCSHNTEQGCAVLQALASGEISDTRYASYMALRRQAAHGY